jgi:tetratricopeptide (TPR) repeat protein
MRNAPTEMKTKKASQPAGKSSFNRKLLPFAILWALTLGAYSNSFSSGLIFDNASIIKQDPRIRAVTGDNLGLILTKEYWYPSTGNNLYRPLTTLTYLANYAVLGNAEEPAGYHFVNYVIHSLNACLVFLIGLLLFGETLPALALAAIWAAHPALTESVTNVVGRADLLGAFGILAALVCFARYREGASGRMVWLAGACLATAVGVFSKESAIVALGAVPLFDLAFPRRAGIATWRDRALGYAAIALPCALFLIVRNGVLAGSPAMHIPFTDNPIIRADFLTGRLTAIGVIGREIALLLFPLRLSADYSYNAIPLASGVTPWNLFGALVLAAAAAGAIGGYLRDRKFFFWILFGLGALLPTSNLVFPVGTIMAERFLYLPALALSACLVTVLWNLRERFSTRVFQSTFAAMALLLAVRTFARNVDWQTEGSLFQAAAEAQPESYRGHSGLASAFLAERKLDDAAREADRALAILNPLPDDRNVAIPYVSSGRIYDDKADSAPAAEEAQWRAKALAALHRAQRIVTATEENYKREDEAQGKPYHPLDWSMLDEHLGYASLRAGAYEESIAATRRAMQYRLNPGMLLNLSAALAAKGDAREAEIALLEAKVWHPTDRTALTRTIAIFKEKEPGSCALEEANSAYRLNTACPLVHAESCEAAARLASQLDAIGEGTDAEQVRASARQMSCGQ